MTQEEYQSKLEQLSVQILGLSALTYGLGCQYSIDNIDRLTDQTMNDALVGLASSLESIAIQLNNIHLPEMKSCTGATDLSFRDLLSDTE